MTGHWLKFQNGPARCSRVKKRLKYYKLGNFAPLGTPRGWEGGGGAGVDPKSEKNLRLNFDPKNIPAKFQRDRLNSFWEIITEEKKTVRGTFQYFQFLYSIKREMKWERIV